MFQFHYTRVLHPCLLWAQRNDILLLTINLTDIKHEKLSLNENKLTFEGVGGPEGRQYACELEFMEQIVPQVPIQQMHDNLDCNTLTLVKYLWCQHDILRHYPG